MHPGVPAAPVLKTKVEPSLLVWTPYLKHSCMKTVICKKLPRHFLPKTIFNEVLRMEETMKVLGEQMKLRMCLQGKIIVEGLYYAIISMFTHLNG